MRWQYSLLGLLALTTVIALYLTFANHYPKLATAVLIGGGMWAGTLLAADRFVRTARQRSREFPTIASWIASGSLFLLIAVVFAQPTLAQFTRGRTFSNVIASPSGVAAMLFACAGIVCFAGALRKFARYRRDNRSPTTRDQPNLPR